MHDLWEWAKQNKEGITLFCTILGGIATLTAILSKVGASGYLVAAGARSRPPQWK